MYDVGEIIANFKFFRVWHFIQGTSVSYLSSLTQCGFKTDQFLDVHSPDGVQHNLTGHGLKSHFSLYC